MHCTETMQAYLASVNVVFGKALFGCKALWADIVAAKLLEGLLASIDVSAVNADVCGKLLLLIGQPTAKSSRCRLLGQPLHIHSALSSHLWFRQMLHL